LRTNPMMPTPLSNNHSHKCEPWLPSPNTNQGKNRLI